MAEPQVVATPGGEPTKQWFIKTSKRAPADLIEAFTPLTSVLPGDLIPIHVSTSADEWSIEVFRIGDYDGLGGAKMEGLGPFPGQSYSETSVDSDTKAVKADWPSAVAVNTDGWEPGFYLLTRDGQEEAHRNSDRGQNSRYR